MITFIVAMACLAIGLYAGKRRANGSSWHDIAYELSKGACDLAVNAWNAVSSPFKRDVKNGD